jgi:hypothetical protein
MGCVRYKAGRGLGWPGQRRARVGMPATLVDAGASSVCWVASMGLEAGARRRGAESTRGGRGVVWSPLLVHGEEMDQIVFIRYFEFF